MAMTTCKECKSEISDKAEKCPHCGVEVKKKTSLVKVIVVGAILFWVGKEVLNSGVSATQSTASAQVSDCSATNFTVKVVRTYNESGYTHLIGTAKNDNPIPCGVQVKYSTYDKAGGVLRTNDAWPASIRNIGSGQTENFDFMLQYEKVAVNVDVTPLRAKHWEP